jgi:hypothetical protein
MANESSFTWNGATIRVKELTIGEEEAVTALMARFPKEDQDAHTATIWSFSEFMASAEIEGDPPLPMVTAESSQREIETAMAAWRALPARLQRKWRQAVTAAEGDADPK